MIAAAAAALILAAGVGGADAARADSAGRGPRVEAARIGFELAASDSTKPRRRAVRLSEAYHQRLRIHKLASYAMLPMFAFEYAAGNQLIQKSSAAPAWAVNLHGPVATGIAALFTVNSVTGGLNWWETRNQESGRTWRTVHSALMMAAEAGFVATGALADRAENSLDDRKLHRTVAITSMSIATASYLMMLKPLRRD